MFGLYGLMVTCSANERNKSLTTHKNETSSRIYLPHRHVFRRLRPCMVCRLRGLFNRAASPLRPPLKPKPKPNPDTMKTIKTLKENGWKIRRAGVRHSTDGRIKPVLLLQSATSGLTIDGDHRQLGRQLRQLARGL